MKLLKMPATVLLAVSFLTFSSFAANDVLVPQEVIMGTLADCKTVEKVYVLPKDSDESLISKETFTENDVEYIFEEMKVKDNSEEDAKEYATQHLTCIRDA